MSAAESSRKLRHYGLLSQQKRMRHIQSITLKNLSTDRALLEDDAPENVHFVLLKPGKPTEFYSSEKVQDIVNPSWTNLDLGNSCDTEYNSLMCAIVQIWGSNSNGSRMLVEWKVHLRGLIHIREEVAKDSKKFQPDSIVFGLMDGFYTAKDCLPESEVGNNAKFCSALEVEQSMVSVTYDVFSIARLHTVQRAIKQSEVSLSRAHDSIVEKLTQQEEKTKLKASNEHLLFQISLLQEELKNQKKQLKEDQKLCSEFREKYLQQKSASTKRMDNLNSSKRKLQENLQRLNSMRESLSEVKGDYYCRRSTLIKELAAIYPIDIGPKGSYYIVGVRLPNAESYAGCDDTQIAIALGHTCQLVLMIAKFLQMPLRYPMVHLGSRSIIRDHITAHLSQKERDFPLYLKGKEKMHFNYAVYLLNRNIVQVRTAVKLSTPDLRATLPNLKDLLEQKWGVRRPSPPSLTNSPHPVRSISETGMNVSVSVPASHIGGSLPSNPPQYTESQVDPSLPSFPRSPPPPYEANYMAQRALPPLPVEDLSSDVETIVASSTAASSPQNGTSGETNFESLSETAQGREETMNHSQVEETLIGDGNRIHQNNGDDLSVPESEVSSSGAIEGSVSAMVNSVHTDLGVPDNGTNGFHRGRETSTEQLHAPTNHSEREASPSNNHRIEDNPQKDLENAGVHQFDSHSHQKLKVHSKIGQTQSRHPLDGLDGETCQDDFQDESMNYPEAMLRDAGLAQFAEDISSRTDALSNRGRYSSFNKTQTNSRNAVIE